MKRKIAAVVLGILMAFATASAAFADSTGYEGQPGNQSSSQNNNNGNNGPTGYEGQPGNQAGH